jgi:hypothetical protein
VWGEVAIEHHQAGWHADDVLGWQPYCPVCVATKLEEVEEHAPERRHRLIAPDGQRANGINQHPVMRPGGYRTMLNEEIKDVNDIPSERIRAAIERADEAFWKAIGEAFPEVTSGDFGPDDVAAWEDARNFAVWSWLTYNAPRHKPERHQGLTAAGLPRHVAEHHQTELAEIDMSVDPLPYLAEHGIAATGDHELDVAEMWHHQDHPEERPERQSGGSST